MITQTQTNSNLYAGEVCPLSSDSPADVQGTAPNSQDSNPSPDTFTIGSRVRVKPGFSAGWGKVPRFAGKKGTIDFHAPVSAGFTQRYGTLFSVTLDSGKVETYFSSDLALLEQPTPKGFIQTLLDGVYDVSTQFSLSFKKPKPVKTIPDSVPVQITLFELLKPYAELQYQNMVALLKSCVNDLAELKNPLSRLSKILGKKRDAKLDVLAKQVPAISRDVVNYQVMWGL